MPGLLVLEFLASLPLVRARLVTPALVLGTALGLAAVASWVQPVGDAAAGLLASAFFYGLLAWVLGVVEFAVRAIALRLRPSRRRTARGADATARASSS